MLGKWFAYMAAALFLCLGISGCSEKPRQTMSEAEKKYLGTAQKGNASAQYHLAVCYYKGLGVGQDMKQAANWFYQAAKQNHPKAQYQLAECWYNGLGVEEENHQEAAFWYRKAADNGLDKAQYKLGLCYMEGDGVKQDPQEANKWLKRAMDQGYKPAHDAWVKSVHMIVGVY